MVYDINASRARIYILYNNKLRHHGVFVSKLQRQYFLKEFSRKTQTLSTARGQHRYKALYTFYVNPKNP